MSLTPADSLHLELHVPSMVRAGEFVTITLRARNARGEPLEVYLRGRPIAFDIRIARSDGSVVWRRLERYIIPEIFQVRVIPPGKSLELTAYWDQRANSGVPVDPGSYMVTGALLTDSTTPLETAAAPLRILPREG